MLNRVAVELVARDLSLNERRTSMEHLACAALARRVRRASDGNSRRVATLSTVLRNPTRRRASKVARRRQHVLSRPSEAPRSRMNTRVAKQLVDSVALKVRRGGSEVGNVAAKVRRRD